MDTPLEQWYCDSCGEPIREARHGMLEWTSEADGPAHTFRIVHNGGFSPRGTCYENDQRSGQADWHLQWATGAKGLAAMLNLAMMPTVDPLRTTQVEPGSFFEVLARLHVPYYEEARRYYADARVSQWLHEHGVPDQALSADVAMRAIAFAEAEGIEPIHVHAPV